MPGVTYLTVTKAEAGQKLLQYLERQLQGKVPRSALMRWIRTGQVRVDGARCKPFRRLDLDQTIRLPPHSLPEERPVAAAEETNPFHLWPVHEDPELLVLAKPPNLATQPGSGLSDSVSDRLQTAYAGSDWMPALVHRLDKATSGLLLVAKTYSALQHLQDLWRSGQVCKVYLAWVEGQASWSEWTWLEDTLTKTWKGQVHKVQATAWVRTLRRESRASLVAVRLVTGRKHQIRIQLARREHPVLGDRKHGSGRGSGQGLLLHAAFLGWEERSFRLLPPWQGAYAVTDEELASVLRDV